jgi:hypothetical protein
LTASKLVTVVGRFNVPVRGLVIDPEIPDVPLMPDVPEVPLKPL